MSRFKLINLIDKLFITCCIFLIAYAWINFFIRNLWLTFIFSLIFSLSFSFIVFYLANKKNEKKTSNINHSKMVETNFLAFQLLSKQDKLETIKNIVKKTQKQGVKTLFYVMFKIFQNVSLYTFKPIFSDKK